MRISKSIKTSVKASDTGARTADFIRNKLISKGYTKEEVNSMGLTELKALVDKEGIDVVYSSKSCNSAASTGTSDFIRNKLIAKGYDKSEVNSMGLKELKKLAEKENIDVVYSSDTCNSSTATDKALQYIKAAIDILGKSGDKSDLTKDSIANLGVVMFDLMGKD